MPHMIRGPRWPWQLLFSIFNDAQITPWRLFTVPERAGRCQTAAASHNMRICARTRGSAGSANHRERAGMHASALVQLRRNQQGNGDRKMATRPGRKNEHEDAPRESPSQRKQAEDRFRLQVDGQTKATYSTVEAAEAAGLAIKKSYPVVHVGVYDDLEGSNKIIRLPGG